MSDRLAGTILTSTILLCVAALLPACAHSPDGPATHPPSGATTRSGGPTAPLLKGASERSRCRSRRALKPPRSTSTRAWPYSTATGGSKRGVRSKPRWNWTAPAPCVIGDYSSRFNKARTRPAAPSRTPSASPTWSAPGNNTSSAPMRCTIPSTPMPRPQRPS